MADTTAYATLQQTQRIKPHPLSLPALLSLKLETQALAPVPPQLASAGHVPYSACSGSNPQQLVRSRERETAAAAAAAAAAGIGEKMERRVKRKQSAWQQAHSTEMSKMYTMSSHFDLKCMWTEAPANRT
eukprot:6315947-Amphidinium_carterae.1